MVEIIVEDLEKHFGASKALNKINFTVKPGEIFFLLGPSGCGKTTLLRTIAGFYTPDSGRILFNGEDVTKLPPHKRKTGMVFQSYALWPNMTVWQNVAFGLEQLKVSKKELENRVDEALAVVQMEAYKDRRPAQLSGGQQQRVALARALVVRPRCLLMDEPLSNLDARLRYYMRLEIHRICKEFNLTTIYVTHDQKEALSIADQIAVLNQGEIQQIGNPSQVYKKPYTRFTADFIGATNILEGEFMDFIENEPGYAMVRTPIGILKGILPDPNFRPQKRSRIYISIRPECFTLRENAVELNCFEGDIGRATYYGEVAHYRFLTKNNRLKISELNPHHLGESEREGLFATVTPDDVVILAD